MKGVGIKYGRFGPPTELLTIELVYGLIIFSLCVLILYKTQEIYKLTKHQGIFYFRNIFLFFSLSFLIRIVIVSIPLLSEIVFYKIPRFFVPITIVLISYFSTMAILSLAMTLIYKKVRLNKRQNFILLNAVALFSSIVLLFTKSNKLLLLIQTIIFLVSIIYLLSKGKINKKSLLSHNKITYSLLFIFWLLNMIASIRLMVYTELKYILYIISAGIFFSIFIRVNKRLGSHAKKTR